MDEQKYEVVKFIDDELVLEVSVDPKMDTVWLTQMQIASLFRTTKQNISLHINKIFKEEELDIDAVVKDYLTTASDGKKYKMKFYNLDMIILVGYRVKSKRGIEFRK